ncbi:MAG: Tn3 family transposase [Chloroflexi bacterium]|nr:Tn3 family transposase [Chloroflexota bacterium]
MREAKASEPSKTPKRLYILDDEEIEALYARPRFTEDDRTHAFVLTQSEKDLTASFSPIHSQLYFILQLGYFKAKQLFFSFTFHDVADDVTHLLQRYFPDVPQPKLRLLNKRTILKQRQRILELFQYRLCTPADRQRLFLRAQQAARISSKPVYVFRELLHYLAEQRIVSPGYTVLQEEIVGKALTAETMRLTSSLQTQLSPTTCMALDKLVAETDGLYIITLLKRQPKDFSLGEMRREISCGEHLAPLYRIAMQVVAPLGISNEGITYYASLVSYYSVFRLKQLDTWVVYLYLLCFIVHRYQRFNDNLLTCFIHLVKQYSDEAKTTAKEEVYQQRVTSNQDLPKAGQVLKLFTTDYAPETTFTAVQATAFAMLDRKRLAAVADYIAKEVNFDETALQWARLDLMARRFKQHLRPILRAVDLAATRINAPILEAVEFLKMALQKDRPLRQIDPADFPTYFIPIRDKRYLYHRDRDRDTTGHKEIIPDRYEFLVYRLLRNGLEAGDLFCRDSVRFRSFEDDLIDEQEWQQNKAALLTETGLSNLLQPVPGHLADLEYQLEERIVAVNQRISAGENSHFHLKGKGKGKGRRTRWTLQYPKSSEPINHPVFDTLNQVNISSLLHFVDDHSHFMDCFEHILGRYSKQAVDDRLISVISACLVAWGTNMGLGRMGEISDIGFDPLTRTSENFLRIETLKAANDCVSNASAALSIFRHYDLGGVVHSSSDGQKFETALPTFNARYSPKYFGLKKGVVAYTLLANHVPVNAHMIGAHDHESRFVFDLLFNNTTDIQPEVHSTDTHGTNQVNFALLSIFGYQFAPRYAEIEQKVRTALYGFQHPSQYGDVILKPIRKLNTDLIVAEWDNLMRIFVSLALKTTTQSIIVGKLNAYTRKNKTRQALWEYDNIISSLYLLDFVDSPLIRKNVQRALNRGENYHQLRRAVSYANFGKLRFRTTEDQELWHECSRLITNCIIFYNSSILSRLWSHKEATGNMAGAALIAQVSPVAWQHINFYGRYEFTTNPPSIDLDAVVQELVDRPIVAVEDEEDE